MKQDYAAALNSYFECEPYESWFGSYEAILNEIKASYYSRSHQINRAIHTDICSPITTNPTWSNLSKKTQKELFSFGFQLWKDLINILQPDIILVSIAEHWLKQLNLTNEIEFARKDMRNQPYIIYKYDHVLNTGQVSKVYFGQAAQTPFGKLSKEFKQELGKKILAERL